MVALACVLFASGGYAQSTAFVNGSSTAIGTSGPTQLAILNTTFTAGTNFVIAIVQFDNTGSTDVTIAVGNLHLEKSGSYLHTNAYNIRMSPSSGTADRHKWYALMGIDSSGTANAWYSVTATASATGAYGQAKILAVSSVTGSQVQGTETGITSSETTLATLNTSLPAGDNVVLALIETHNTRGSVETLAAGNEMLKKSGLLLANNQLDTSHGADASYGDWQVQLIPYVEFGAAMNPTYTASALASTSKAWVFGVAKVVAFSRGSFAAAFSDGGPVALGTSEVTVNTLTTSFSAGSEVAVIASEQFWAGNLSSDNEILSGNDKLQQNDDAGTQTTNSYTIHSRQGGTGDSGNGFGLLNRYTGIPASPTYKVKATDTTPGTFTAESKIVALARVPSASLALANHTLGQVADKFTTTTPVTDVLFRFNLTRTGTVTVDNVRVNFTTAGGVANGDVTSGELYLDVNNDGAYDVGDTLIQGSVTPVGGVLTFTTNFTPGTSGTNYLVRATVANLAAGDTTTFSVGAVDIDEVEGGVVESGSISSATHTQDTTLTLADHTVGQVGDQFTTTTPVTAVLFRFKLTRAGTVTVSAIRISYTATGIADGDITAANLYRDENNNGVYDSGTDTALRGGTPSGGVIPFTTLSESPGTGGTDYLVYFTVTNLAPGDTITFSLDATGIDEVQGGVVELGSISNATHTQNATLTMANHSVGQATDQFATTTPVTAVLFRFNLTRAGTVTVSQLRVNFMTTGGVANGDVTAGALYLDADSSGTVTGGDTLIQGGVTPVNGVLTFSSVTLPSGSTNYIVQVTVANLVVGDTTTFSVGTADIDEAESDVLELGSISDATHTQDGTPGSTLLTFNSKYVVTSATAVTTNSAPAFVQKAEIDAGASATGVISFPGVSTSGNLIVLSFNFDNQARTVTSVADNKGNTYKRAIGPTDWNGTTQRAYTYYASNIIANGTAITITITLSAAPTSSFEIWALEYSGVSTVNPLDQTSSGTGIGTLMNSGAKTTTFANELLYGWGLSQSSCTAPGVPWTTRSTWNSNFVVDRTVNATSSYNVSGTNGNSGWAWAVHMLTFKATSLTDDTQASQTFSLSATQTVLAIYNAFNNHGSSEFTGGKELAISVDGTDRANTWNSPYTSNGADGATTFWIGTLAAGSHTIKGRFGSNASGSTVAINERVLLILIFNGDAFGYIDDATARTTTSNSLVSDASASQTFTPSGACKALFLYNVGNVNGVGEELYGKKAAINLGGTNYSQSAKSAYSSSYSDNVFALHYAALSATSNTVQGTFASHTNGLTVTISRRQLGILLFADTTDANYVTDSTTSSSTTSAYPQDDTPALISRTTTDTRELLVVAVGTKPYLTTASATGVAYGIKVDTNDRSKSRASGNNLNTAAVSASTAYAENLAAGSHTIQGRFGNNNGTDTAVILSRQIVAFWFASGGLVLADHILGQVADRFTSTTPVTDVLFRFKLTRTGTVTVDNLRVNFTTAGGVANGDVTSGELYLDVNNDGAYDGGDTLIQGSVTPVAGVLTFTTNFTPGTGGTNYLVRATVANLVAGDTTTFSVGTADIDEVESGIIESGSITSATHTQDSLVLGCGQCPFNYFGTPIDITPGTTGSWADVDVSAYVPTGATGVILQALDNNATTSKTYGVRMNGSTDTWMVSSYQSVPANGMVFLMAGVDASRIFEMYNATEVTTYLIGYTMAGVTFFTNAPDKTSLLTAATWSNVDITADTADSKGAIGAIFTVHNTSANGLEYGLRKNGSTDDALIYKQIRSATATVQMIGLDSGDVAQAKFITPGAGNLTLHLTGYIREGAYFFTNAVDKSTLTTGSYVDVDITGNLQAGDTANGAILEAVDGTTGAYAFRRNGTSYDYYKDARHVGAVTAVDGSNIFEQKIALASRKLYLNGYTLACTGNFTYRRPITLNYAQRGANCTTIPIGLPSFPVLVSLSGQTWLKTRANGGNVATFNGYDILFRAADGVTQLDHEIERYDGANGNLIAWVRIPALFAGDTNTTIYIYYGNGAITAATQNPTGVWDSNYLAVYHMNQVPSSGILDSKGTYSLTAGGTTSQGTGQIGYGVTLSTGYLLSTATLTTTSFTIEGWVQNTATGAWPNWQAIVDLDAMPTTSRDFTVYPVAAIGSLGVDNGSGAGTARVSDPQSGTTWRHVAVAYTSGGTQYGFINGTKTSHTPTPGWTSLTARVLVGSWWSSGTGFTDYWSGTLDEIRISNKARDDCWISTESNNMSAPTSFATLGAEGAAGPTAVEMVSLDATGYPGRGVQVSWRTGFEVDNLGFHVYREVGGERVRLTPSLVAGSALFAGPGTPLTAGRSYSWWDRSPIAGSSYWLEEWELSGERRWHGPVSVQPGAVGVQAQAQGLTVPASGESVQGSSPLLAGLGESASPSRPQGVRRKLRQGVGAGPDRLGVQWGLASRAAVKLLVSEEGWTRVSQEELVRAGLDPSVDPSRLQLFADGLQVPILLDVRQPGVFASGDGIEFYGQGLDTPSTAVRVYWLVVGSGEGLRIPEAVGGGEWSPGPASFPYEVERADRTLYFPSLLNGDEDNFFGAVVTSTPVVQVVRVQHVDLSGPGELSVRLQGGTAGAHRVGVDLNGTRVGTVIWNDLLVGEVAVPLGPGMIAEGDNRVVLVAEGGEGDASAVESIRVRYAHTWEADGEALEFSLGGYQEVSIGGFRSAQVRVVDITDPWAVQVLPAEVVEEAGAYRATVGVPEAGERTVLAVGTGAIRHPVGVLANRPTAWHAAAEGADLLIIAHRSLLSAVEPLRVVRESQGLKVAVVDVEDVYDEFSFGAKDPQAIKDFLAYVKDAWSRPPRYLLLVGDASYDPRSYLGQGYLDLVPTKLVDTTYLETASDDWFADFNNDGIADIPVGRLPVQTLWEATTVVNKIVAYDGSAKLGRVLLVADANDKDNDFEGLSAQVEAVLPSTVWPVKVYRGQLGDGAAKLQLMNGIDLGQTLINYVGHGTVNAWGGYWVTAGEARTLHNDRFGLVVSMTCLNGFFHDPFEASLAEAFLQAPAGGAVAIWASSGLTESADQLPINETLVRLLYSGTPITLGDAMRAAKAAASDMDVRRTWTLFGDPTTRLRR